MAAARAALPIPINVCRVNLDQDLTNLLQDEFGQGLKKNCFSISFSLVGNSGHLAWVRLWQLQEQRYPLLSMCVVSVWTRIWQTFWPSCRMSLGSWACILNGKRGPLRIFLCIITFVLLQTYHVKQNCSTPFLLSVASWSGLQWCISIFYSALAMLLVRV